MVRCWQSQPDRINCSQIQPDVTAGFFQTQSLTGQTEQSREPHSPTAWCPADLDTLSQSQPYPTGKQSEFVGQTESDLVVQGQRHKITQSLMGPDTDRHRLGQLVSLD